MAHRVRWKTSEEATCSTQCTNRQQPPDVLRERGCTVVVSLCSLTHACTRCQVATTLVDLTSDRSLIEQRLASRPPSSGQTCISCGLEKAQDMLRTNARPAALVIVLLITDGAQTVGGDHIDLANDACATPAAPLPRCATPPLRHSRCAKTIWLTASRHSRGAPRLCLTAVQGAAARLDRDRRRSSPAHRAAPHPDSGDHWLWHARLRERRIVTPRVQRAGLLYDLLLCVCTIVYVRRRRRACDHGSRGILAH
jgi:hypothetical protein